MGWGKVVGAGLLVALVGASSGTKTVAVELIRFEASQGGQSAALQSCFQAPTTQCISSCTFDRTASCHIGCPMMSPIFCRFAFLLSLASREGKRLYGPFYTGNVDYGLNTTFNASADYGSWRNPKSLVISDAELSAGVTLQVVLINENGYPAHQRLFHNQFLHTIDQFSQRGPITLETYFSPADKLFVNVNVHGTSSTLPHSTPTPSNVSVTSPQTTSTVIVQRVYEDKSLWIGFWCLVALCSVLLIVLIVLCALLIRGSGGRSRSTKPEQYRTPARRLSPVDLSTDDVRASPTYLRSSQQNLVSRDASAASSPVPPSHRSSAVVDPRRPSVSSPLRLSRPHELPLNLRPLAPATPPARPRAKAPPPPIDVAVICHDQ